MLSQTLTGHNDGGCIFAESVMFSTFKANLVSWSITGILLANKWQVSFYQFWIQPRVLIAKGEVGKSNLYFSGKCFQSRNICLTCGTLGAHGEAVEKTGHFCKPFHELTFDAFLQLFLNFLCGPCRVTGNYSFTSCLPCRSLRNGHGPNILKSTCSSDLFQNTECIISEMLVPEAYYPESLQPQESMRARGKWTIFFSM